MFGRFIEGILYALWYGLIAILLGSGLIAIMVRVVPSWFEALQPEEMLLAALLAFVFGAIVLLNAEIGTSIEQGVNSNAIGLSLLLDEMKSIKTKLEKLENK